MEVVLLKEVEQLGPAGAVVRVKPGFARNYLLPMGLAAPATTAQLKALNERKRQRERQVQREQGEAQALKQKLEGLPVTLTLNVGEDGKPFGAITTHDVADALATAGLALDRHAIRLDQPIKTLGVHEIPVRMHPDVTAMLRLTVVKA